MTLRAALVLILSLAFAASPWVTDGFAGFDPSQFPVRVEAPPAQPAGYAFAIWGPIYLWLIASAAFGLWRRRDDPAWDATRLPLIVSLGAGVPWIAVAVASPVWATVLIWIMWAGAALALVRTPATDPWLLRAPLGLYAGWLTAASCVSLALLAGGYGLPPLGPGGWALAAVALALVLALLVLRTRASLMFGAAVAWALVAVVVRNGADAVGLVAAAGALVVAGATLRRLARARR